MNTLPLQAFYPKSPSRLAAKSAGVPRSRTVAGTSQRVLSRIRERDINLALWNRTLPAEVADFCAALAAHPASFSLDVTGLAGPALRQRLATAFVGTAATPTPAWLLDDMGVLAAEFSAVARCAAVRIRLTKVADDGCAAFHVDTLPLRLICTYAGQGTQWADETDVRRNELGMRGRSVAEANATIVPDPARIRTMPTGAVAIMKGRLWPSLLHTGLVHRSHPVCCGEHARLRLAIDPADLNPQAS